MGDDHTSVVFQAFDPKARHSFPILARRNQKEVYGIKWGGGKIIIVKDRVQRLSWAVCSST